MKRRSFGQWILLFLTLLLLTTSGTVLSFTLFTLANYSETVDRLVSNIKIGESIEIKKDMVRLNYFYELSKSWKAQWLADKYLFKDASFYEAADFYLIRDWQRVIYSLRDKQDDVRAYPFGNAKFRQAQSRYQAGDPRGALSLLGEITIDFEKALRNCLDSGAEYDSCFDRVWNYDLITNKKDAEEALKNPIPKRILKFMLGPIKDKNAPPMIKGDKKDDDGGGREGKEEGGAGSPLKRP